MMIVRRDPPPPYLVGPLLQRSDNDRNQIDQARWQSGK